MSELEALLTKLQHQQIKIWAEGDKLRYRAPKGQVTDELLTALKKHKAELLAHWLAADKPTPIPDRAHYALSAAQQRLWLLAQMDENSAAYNIPLHLELKGAVDEAALRHTLAYLMQRHESLRTGFITVDDEPRQTVADTPPLPYESIDFSTTPNAESSVERYLQQYGQSAFDLRKPPLFHVRLLKLNTHRHVLAIVMHHIISDGWSIGVLMRELWQSYHACCEKRAVVLPELTIQYRDFAAWQNRQLASPAIDTHRQYWLRQLSGDIPVLNLPTDFPRPPVQTFNGHELSFTVGELDGAVLQDFCQRHRISLFMLLQALVAVLCYRYSEQTDILVGSPIAGRNALELEHQIGFYINTLVLRHRFQARQSFSDLLQHVRQTTTEAYDHQLYPFDRLINELQLQRDLSRSPLFDVMVILQNASGELASSVGDLTIEPIIPPVQTSKFDLTWHFHDGAQGLTFSIEYNRDLFGEARIQRMGRHFTTLLHGALDRPGTALERLALLTGSERDRLLYDFNTTVQELPEAGTVADLIADQARKRPQAPAVIGHDGRLSYRQLYDASQRLADRLRQAGIGTGDRIGLCLQRGTQLPVALLAILQTGAAYVPLDPYFPAERLAFMVTDAQLKSVLTESALDALVDAWASAEATPRLYVDRPELDRHPAVRSTAERPPTPEDLAYIIYTSGSTGRPKGVPITQRSLLNFLNAMQRLVKPATDDALLAVTTLSFDIAGLELYLPLISGARVVIATREQAGDGHALADLIARETIGIMQATPATWRLLLEANWQGRKDFKALCGGEALPGALANALREKTGEAWNLYGPTETTIWSSAHRLTDSVPPSEIASIGRPIDNTQFYVLDHALQPSPIGVTGELFIGGEGLSPGYWRRPELTAEKFAANPFADGRIYRTGDLAYIDEDGRFFYVGRIDHQVKLRGFRIELGEIEALLSEHEAVEQAVVAVSDSEGEPFLAAYLVLDTRIDRFEPDTAWRDWLKRHLPDYMLPSRFIVLDALPLTPNGKIDRKALPTPNSRRSVGSDRRLAPRNDLEADIADVWQAILGLDTIGVTDNFFALGGHSLTAMKVINALQRDRRIHFKLADIFQHPTVAQLAELAASREDDTDESALMDMTALTAEEWALLADDD